MPNTEFIADTIVIRKPAGKKMLLVEDVPDLAETLQAILVEHGHDVEVAPNGRDAIARFQPGKYDLIITDYSMPKMNGIEMAEIIRRRAARQKMLMVTAYAFTIAAYDGRPLPVDFILRKPFQPDEFHAAIEHVLHPKKGAAKGLSKAAG
jgi:CheY-like chemotaxis protein